MNSSFSEKFIAIDSNSSSRGGLDLQVNAIPTNSQMDQIPLHYTLEHMEDGSSVVSAPAPKVKVTPKKVLLKLEKWLPLCYTLHTKWVIEHNICVKFEFNDTYSLRLVMKKYCDNEHHTPYRVINS